MIRGLLKYRGLGINLLAGCCFIGLAIYGWGLSWKEVGNYFFAIIACLGGLIVVAAGLGALLRRAMRKK